MENLSLEKIAALLSEQSSVVLSTHISPDPDAIGSSFALAAALQALGKETFVYLADPLPERLQSFVNGINYGHEVPQRTFSAFVAIDTASEKRVGKCVAKVRATAKLTINIDHHISNDLYGDFNYIDATAPASALIVWELLPILKVTMNPQIANLLYAGLLDDTGCFCFSNTTSRAFACAGALVDCGAEPARIANEIYFTQPLRTLKLNAAALESLKLELDGKVAYISISREKMESTGAKSEDAEGLVDLARRVGGTTVAVLQREIEDGWKISLRSKNESFDVNEIAGLFGGGGHKAAAGCKLRGTQEQVEQRILACLKEKLANV